MGLGKTIQTICFLAHLREATGIKGPHIIVAPKSTIGNWCNEFKKWCPAMKLVKLIAAKPFRDEILKNEMVPGKFDVVVTSFEGINICNTALRKFNWRFIIIDEAHKIKNEDAQISKSLRTLPSEHRLLLTGTPLQNNLHELWALLNFLLPNLFKSSEDFDSWFDFSSTEGTQEDIENANVQIVQRLHRLLRPFLLRRTKSEVERGIPPKKEILLNVNLTTMQKDLYKKILTNELRKSDNKGHYLNVVMQLRKVCNHPYLFPGIEDDTLEDFSDHIATNSGKLALLDRLLVRLKANKSQVLIFSQMTSMLDILEDYCTYREFKFCRLDGSTDLIDRENMMEKFTRPNSSKFIFLLSTRAGGLGINLATADTVIIYDSDWNPQMDLQAMDRAHRIGQTKQVNVYRMITSNTLEERIIERQCLRLKLDSLVIQQGRLAPKKQALNKNELQEMLHYGADTIFNISEEMEIADEDLDTILSRGEQKFNDINSKLDEQIDDKKKKNLIDFDTKIDMWNFESVDYSIHRKAEASSALYKAIDESLTADQVRRDRKPGQNYNVDKKFDSLMTIPTGRTREFRPVADFRFFKNRDRLIELQRKEFNKIELLQEERDELNELMKTGSDWSRKEYQSYVKGCELYGQSEVDQIAAYIETKTPQEVEDYAEIFWSRIDELADKDRILKCIERRQNQLDKCKNAESLIESKFAQYENPWKQLTFESTVSHKSKIFTLENDRLLICLTKSVGYGNWDELKALIRKSQYCKFDYVLKTRTCGELQRRVDSLIRILEKDEEERKKKIEREAQEKEKRAREFVPFTPPPIKKLKQMNLFFGPLGASN